MKHSRSAIKSAGISILFFLVCSTVSFGMSGIHNINYPSVIGSIGGNISSPSNKMFYCVGSVSLSKMTSTNFMSSTGFIKSTLLASDTLAPTITNIKFNGRSIAEKDFINGNSSLTADIADIGSGISLEASFVVIDGVSHSFASLTSPSTYEVSTDTLTYKLLLPDGDHTIQLSAKDKAGNSSSASIAVKTSLQTNAFNSVLVYPNPFNSLSGTAKIAYQLSSDSDIIVYIFDQLNRPVWRQNFISGTNGGYSGYNEIIWDGKNSFGEYVGNGAYFLKLVSNGKVIGKTKIAVVK